MSGFRTFIDKLEKAGQLVRVPAAVHWKYELGAYARRVQLSDPQQPALLFENVTGYPEFPVLTNGLGSHGKLAMALGLEPGASFADVVTVFKRRSRNVAQPFVTDTSPVTGNVLLWGEADLERLPAPWYCEEDGGRYVGTWHINVSKDPETGARNLGVYRMQLLGPRQTAVSVSPRSHLALHLAKAERLGVPLEMAVAIGVDETVVMAAAAGLPADADEYGLAGALAGRAVPLVKGRTVELEIPAASEVVLEGTIDPRHRVEEGPFLDYAGMPKRDRRAFVFDVSCLMYRKDAIFRGAAIGVAGGEDHILFSVLAAAGCLDFHGSRIRRAIQNALIRRRAYRLFQHTGRLRQIVTSILMGRSDRQ